MIGNNRRGIKDSALNILPSSQLSLNVFTCHPPAMIIVIRIGSDEKNSLLFADLSANARIGIPEAKNISAIFASVLLFFIDFFPIVNIHQNIPENSVSDCAVADYPLVFSWDFFAHKV